MGAQRCQELLFVYVGLLPAFSQLDLLIHPMSFAISHLCVSAFLALLMNSLFFSNIYNPVLHLKFRFLETFYLAY